jgi:glucoamylase
MTTKNGTIHEAPGAPGGPARWAHGMKTAAGTSCSDTSLVWFTLGRGVLNEVFYPRIDSPCIRDAGFIVTASDGFFSDERTDTDYTVSWLEDGIPAFSAATTCRSGRYRFEKTILTDDRLNTVLQQSKFVVLSGDISDYRVFVYVNPHVYGRGQCNTAWVESFKGRHVLFASRGDVDMALLTTHRFLETSVGFVEKSDGLRDLREHGRLTDTYLHAEDGNVALIGEIDLNAAAEFTVAYGFGLGPTEAAHHAYGALQSDFEEIKERYVKRWKKWQQSLRPLSNGVGGRDLYRISTAMMRVHANKATPGAVASLSVPWGEHRGDEDLLQGAYHLVWPRDVVNHATGLLAAGDHEEAKDILAYLRNTQEDDGHWPQNMWLAGSAFWDGVQLDQTAQPILLADLMRRERALSPVEQKRFWPMVLKAAQFLTQYGPATELDRWEDKGGYNAHTLSTVIAALLTAAEWADTMGESSLAIGLTALADSWNQRLEGWMYVRGTSLAARVGVDGYYARILPKERVFSPACGDTEVKLLPRKSDDKEDESELPPEEVVAVDALSLVRFGLRRPDDSRILNTVRAIDALLLTETERGPVWHRYRGDRFGEHDDGRPFHTTDKGKGRAWPLLIGERAHYELLRGDLKRAQALCRVMAEYATDTGLIPEQVWDADDVPKWQLCRGGPTGSVCPLLWAHGEYVKLRRSIKDGQVFDGPPQTFRRYLAD